MQPELLFTEVPERAAPASPTWTRSRAPWVDGFVDRGSLVFADVGWDDTGAWDAAALRDRLEGCPRVRAERG